MLEAFTPVKVSEGYGRQENEIPIDINYSKLLEWLVDRKQLGSDWRQRLRLIQAKAAELPPVAAGRDADAPLDFFTVRDTRDALAETAERNMLGQLKGNAAAWHKLVGAYEKGGVWLGEAAQTLIRNVDFEIPAAKKQITRGQQQLVDLQKRKGEYLQSAVTAAAAYKQECKELGVAGQNVEAELRGLEQLLRQQLSTATASCTSSSVVGAVRYYEAFAAYAHEGVDATALLPVLKAVQAGGLPPGTELAEVREQLETGAHGAPTAAGGSAGNDAAETDAGGDAGISWDIDFSALDQASAAEGDAADEHAPSKEDATSSEQQLAGTTAANGVDWDVQIDSHGDDTAAAAIDWDVSLEYTDGAAQIEQSSTAGAAAAAAAANGMQEADEDKLISGLICSSEARTRLLDDLHELEAFLRQRDAELVSANSEALAAVAPEAVQQVDASAVKAQLQGTSAAIAALRDEQLKQLLLVRSSSRYRARLQQHLQQAAAKETKFKQAAEETEGKRVETQRKLMADAPKLPALISRTATIKEGVEKALSAALGGRPVNVIGEINNVLG